ncbi:translation initiation factor IF-2 [Equus asinus]|uniref:translation initiation factor IF-2 n=1 Tax=Equus asinus TaxID=9793 RepID=UPI0038F6CDA7
MASLSLPWIKHQLDEKKKREAPPEKCRDQRASERARAVRVPTTERFPNRSETIETARAAAASSLGLSGPEWKRGRLAPGPAPSDPPLCHPPRDKLGGTRTSARVWPFWSLPTEADRGHRGRQGYPRGTPIPRPRAPPSASPAGQPKRCSGAHLTSPQTVSLPPPREPPHPSCHPLRRRPGAAGPSPGPSAGRRLTWRVGRQDGGKWRPGGAGRGRAPGAGGGGGGSGCCRYSCRSVQLLLRHRLLGLPRCQERPKRGSASSQSLPVLEAGSPRSRCHQIQFQAGIQT